ncbi:MAG: hypothetical protein RIQ47_615 [Bacteroidota bacterium]|jgi:uncharacterized membrane-anchored protein YitT (DUF2179 family)
MNSFITNIVIRAARRNNSAATISSFRLAKAYRELKIVSFRLLKDAALIIAGILAAAFGLEGFLMPNGFIDGGATGISLLVSELTDMELWMLIVLINIPFVVLGSRVVSKVFAIKTAIAIACLATLMAAASFPQITSDKLLVAVFGGFFLGAGIGLSVRGGAVIDGTEVLAIYLSRLIGTTIGDIIILINIIIFSCAAYFLSIETALYSMVTYLSASKTLDFVVEGLEEYTSVSIISSHSDEIRTMIIEKMGRGVTLYAGKRGFGKRGDTKDVEIVFTVITRLEMNRLQTELKKIDPNAFVVISSVKDIKGGMVKRRPLDH